MTIGTEFLIEDIKDFDGNIINSILNKKAVISSFIEGKKLIKPNLNDCEEIGKIHQRHPNHEVYWNGELKMKWTKLDVYKRGDSMPFSCDFSKSYYSEENP